MHDRESNDILELQATDRTDDKPIFPHKVRQINLDLTGRVDKTSVATSFFPRGYKGEKVELPKWLSPTRSTLNHYLAEVDKTPRLSADEETAFGRLGINKPLEDTWKLVLHNRPLAVHYSSIAQMANPTLGLSLIDFLDVANPALFRSAEKYDSTVIGKKGLPVRFGYFAGNLIRMNINVATTKQKWKNSVHVGLDESNDCEEGEGLLNHELIADETADSPSTKLAESDIPRLVNITLANMDDFWQRKYGTLVRSRLGVDRGFQPRTYREVKDHLGYKHFQNAREKLVTRAMPAFRTVFSSMRDHPELYTRPTQTTLSFVNPKT
jgi:hypothetical protein